MHIARPARRRNTIVITSLVDVMFVLLFFFMLTSSYLDWGALEVDTAAVKPPPHAAQAPSPLHRLQMLAGARLVLDGRPVAPEQLASLLPPASHVIVQPAAGVPLQDMIRVVDRLKAGGVRLSLGPSPAAP